MPSLKTISMSSYAFLIDESLFTRLPFDVIEYLITVMVISVVYLMSAWFLDSELSTCS